MAFTNRPEGLPSLIRVEELTVQHRSAMGGFKILLCQPLLGFFFFFFKSEREGTEVRKF